MRIIQRIIAPIIVLAGGLACLGYGPAVHQAPVTHEEQLPVPMPPPSPFAPMDPSDWTGQAMVASSAGVGISPLSREADANRQRGVPRSTTGP